MSDVSSPVYIDPQLAACYHGDYDQQIQDAGFGYIQWSDDRNIQSGHQDPDVWFDKEAFAPDYTLDVTPASQFRSARRPMRSTLSTWARSWATPTR